MIKIPNAVTCLIYSLIPKFVSDPEFGTLYNIALEYIHFSSQSINLQGPTLVLLAYY